MAEDMGHILDVGRSFPGVRQGSGRDRVGDTDILGWPSETDARGTHNRRDKEFHNFFTITDQLQL